MVDPGLKCRLLWGKQPQYFLSVMPHISLKTGLFWWIMVQPSDGTRRSERLWPQRWRSDYMCPGQLNRLHSLPTLSHGQDLWVELSIYYGSCNSLTLWVRVRLNSVMNIWFLFNQIMKRIHLGMEYMLQWPKLLILPHVFIRYHLICHYNSK